MRVTLIIHSLGAGGAERIMSLMANYWARQGWPTTLLTIVGPDARPFFSLDPAVALRPLDLARASPTPFSGAVANLRRLRALRRAIIDSAPDVVIVFMTQTNVLTLAATAGLGFPVIVEEHTDPRHAALGRPWRALRRLLYPRAARVIALSDAALSYFPLAIRRRGVVMPNPVVLPVGDAPPLATEGRAVLALGRLVDLKGFDLLLESFARVAPHHPEWVLEIWGEGPCRVALEARRDALGLAGRAHFPGLTPRPLAELRRAGLFALSSRYEGFPTVLGEAMACGLPVVSFDCPSGPRQLVRDGVDGVLVPPGDVAALAAALDRLMGDAAERRRLAARAPEVLTRFGLDQIMGRWASLIAEVVR